MKCPKRKVEGISIREFARRDGCSEKLVRRFIERGSITKFSDGSVDPSCIGTGWRESARRDATGADTSAKMVAVRTKVPAAVAPVEVTTFAIAADSWVTDLAVILLRHGIPQEQAEGICQSWLSAARKAAVEALADVPMPLGCRSWAKHLLFTTPWPNVNSGTWADFKADAGVN